MGEFTDKVSAAADKVAGKVKEEIGKATDNEWLEAEGEAQQLKGTGQDVKGSVKCALSDKLLSSEGGGGPFIMVLGSCFEGAIFEFSSLPQRETRWRSPKIVLLQRDDWHLTDAFDYERGRGFFAAAVRATRMPMVTIDPRKA